MSKQKKEVRLVILVDASMAQALREVAAEIDESVAEIVRRAVHAQLYTHPLVQQSASGAGATHPQVIVPKKAD
jgi:hypothetical protein